MEAKKSKQIAVASRVNFEWIIEFKKEVATEENLETLTSTYPFIVPHQMRLLKESAYSPRTGLYLGLNLRDPGTSQENSMHKLKARWTRAYFNQRRKTVHTMYTSKASSSQSNYSEWDSLVHSLLPILEDCFKRFALIDDQHHEDEMKDVLVADAMFIFMYLLHNRPPPQSEFNWLTKISLFVPNGIPIWYDIFLLENQVPLQLLEHIARDMFQNFRVFVPVNITHLYNREVVPGLLHQFQSIGEIVIREVVSEAIMSRFRSVFRVSSQFESHNCLQDIVLQLQLQKCDHLLDALLRVICYEPFGEQGQKNMGQWALGRWKGIQRSNLGTRGSPQSISMIEWGFQDAENRDRYDIKFLIGTRSDMENHLRLLRGTGGGETSEITVESIINSLNVRMRPRSPNPSLEHIDFRFDREFSGLALKYLLSPELILRFVAVEYGIAPNIVEDAIQNLYIYLDPEPHAISTMQEEECDLLRILPHVRVIVKTLGGTGWSRTLRLSSLLNRICTPRWVRVRLIGIIRPSPPSPPSPFKLMLVHVLGLPFQLLGNYHDLDLEMMLEQVSSWVTSVVSYIVGASLALMCLAWPPLFISNSRKFLSPREIITTKYRDLRFRSPTQFQKRIVRALECMDSNVDSKRYTDSRIVRALECPYSNVDSKRYTDSNVDSKRYGLIFIYFAERMLLHEALVHALRPEIQSREPALAKVLQQAIEARPDFKEFPAYTRRRWLSPHATIDPPMHARWRKRLLMDHAYMKEDNWIIPSATKLKEAGIGIGTCDLIHQTHLDLGGRPILRVPKLVINDEADSLLRNLAALERIKSPLSETPLASFIKLMDNLIDTPEDVSVLRDAGVIVHHLGRDAEVANLWNEMGSGLRHWPSERWAMMLTHINIISRDKKRLMWAEFKKKYMSRPWLVAGVVAAILLLVLAIVQTTFTGFQVFLRLPL